jgi:hypothetical protein
MFCLFTCHLFLFRIAQCPEGTYRKIYTSNKLFRQKSMNKQVACIAEGSRQGTGGKAYNRRCGGEKVFTGAI